MGKQKLTPWFPGTVEPVRPGVYLATVDKREKYYRRWDGKTWYIGGGLPWFAATQTIPTEFEHGELHWRGLAEEPK